MLKRVKLDIQDKKALLRKQFKTLREKIPLEVYLQNSLEICHFLLESLYYQRAKKIAFYSAINREVDLTFALKRAFKEKEVYLPRTDLKERSIFFHRVEAFTELKRGPYGILEPSSEAKMISVKELDLILVPGLAFDLRRGRLGYGGGFYDRALKETSALKIGIAFFCQITEELPLEPFDAKMDLILTEKGWL